MAFQGIDLLEAFRSSTLRALLVRIDALPYDSPLWSRVMADQEAAQKAKPDEIRARQAEWKRRNDERRKREAAS